MLELRPNCECCDRDLPPASPDAMICTFECTFCRDCVDALGDICPNCGGGFTPRPVRPSALLEKFPPSTERVLKPESCRPMDRDAASPGVEPPSCLVSTTLDDPLSPSFEPYRERPAYFLHLADLDGWKVKVYGLSARGSRPDPATVAVAEHHARTVLPSPPVWSPSANGSPPAAGSPPANRTDHVSLARYGVAILIVHEGREGVFVLVSWWVGENMLHQIVFIALSDDPSNLEPLRPQNIIACVWELPILTFERDAWVHHVLANDDGPDFETYLSTSMPPSP